MTTIPASIKMFPDTRDVFADKIEEHAKVLFPLFSVDLKQINQSWDGQLHLLHFNEDPYNRETVSSFNAYCKDNMFAFDVIDNKYSFKTDFRYFDLTPDWVEWFEKTKTFFLKPEGITSKMVGYLKVLMVMNPFHLNKLEVALCGFRRMKLH